MAKTAIKNLKPGRTFTYPWNTAVEGTLLRISSGAAVVDLKRVEEVLDLDEFHNEVEAKKTVYEKNVTISLETVVQPTNRSADERKVAEKKVEKAEAKTVTKKARKPRSDKGKKRGPYGKRTSKKGSN